MTATVRFCIIGLVLVGVGLGAYFINDGLKSDQPAPKDSQSAPLANADSGQTPGRFGIVEPEAGPAMEPAMVPPVQPAAVAGADHNTGQEASPAPLGVREDRADTERSWRPRPLETSEARPSVPSTLPAGLAGHAPAGELAPTRLDADQLTAGPASASPGSRSDQMSLREQPEAARPEKADAVKPAAAAPEAAQKMTIHVVKPGETFTALAIKYLGHAKHVKLIEKANPRINPNRLYVGTKLKIPAAPEAPKATPTDVSGSTAQASATGQRKTAPKAPPVDPAKAYTVQPGDSWAKLAADHLGDSNWTVLYEYNKERFPANNRTLHPGMVIEIPSKSELLGSGR